MNGYIRDKRIDHEFKKHDEVITFQDHMEQKLDGVNSDMFCIGPGDRINPRQWRPASEGGDGLFETYWKGHDAVAECYRHSASSSTWWLDGRVSKTKESTGEDVPVYGYTGERPDSRN